MVKDYYETIKKPMDFGTISRKVDGGSYNTLAEFEHDIFLVSSNAMEFNAETTIYYKQACAMRDLSQKMFNTLQNDPKNFERQCSVLRHRVGRRKQNVFSGQSTAGLAPKGSREVKVNQQSGEVRLGTSRLWDKVANENNPVVSSVYRIPESSNPILNARMGEAGYEGSLMQFAKGLGPKPQTLVQEKVQKLKADEASRQMAALKLEPQTRKYEISNVASGYKGIPSSLYTRSQNFGGKMDMQLNVQKASVLGTPNINDTLGRGFVQAGNNVEYTGAYGQKLVQGIGDGGVSFNQSIAGQGVNTPYLSTLRNNPHSFSANLFSKYIDKGKKVLRAGKYSFSNQNLLNFNRKLVPPMRERDNSSKDNLPCENVGNKNPSLSTTWHTNNSWDKVRSSYMNMGENFQMAEATASHPVQNPGDLQRNTFQSMNPEGNAFKQNLPAQGIESYYPYPPLLQAGDSYLPGAENMLYNYDILVQSAINMDANIPMTVPNPTSLLQSPGNNLGESVQTMTDGAAAFKDLMPDQGTGSLMQISGSNLGKSVQTMTDSAAAFEDLMPVQGTGSLLQSPGNNLGKLLQTMIDSGAAFKDLLTNQRSLLQSPGNNLGKSVQTMTDNGAAFEDLMTNQGTGSLLQSLLHSPGNNIRNSVQTMTDSGAAFKDIMPNQGSESSYVSNPLLSYFPDKANPGSNPEIFNPTSINNDAMNVPIPGMTSSGPSMLDTPFGILSSATLESLLPAGSAGLDVSSLLGGVNQFPAVGAGGGANYAGNFERASQALSRPQPTQWSEQPVFNFPMQKQPRTAVVDLAGQAASSEWQALGAYTPNVQVTAAASSEQPRTAAADLAGQAASLEWQALGAYAPNMLLVMVDASMMNWTHSTDPRQEESNTRAPPYNNHKQTGL